MSATTHSAVLLDLAAAVEAIDPERFQQRLEETWTEALSPFGDSSAALPDTMDHLGYAVFLGQSRPSGGTRQTSGGDGFGGGGGMEVESAIDVVWTYRLRHDSQMADYRLALDSAVAVVRAVLAETWSQDASALCVNAGEPMQIEGEPWLLIRTSFLISYEIGG